MLKKNRTILLIALGLLVIAAALLLNRKNTTLSRRDRDFAVSDTSSVTRIFMADKSGNSVLLQRTDSLWTVNRDYKARPDAVSVLLKTILKVDVLEPVPGAARNNIIKRLAASGVKIEIYQRVYRIDLFGRIRLFPHEKRTKVYYVGSNTSDNLGTYMILEGSEVPFVTGIPGFRGYIAVRYSPRIEEWRDHTVFATPLSEIRSLRTEFVEVPGFSYEVNRSGERSFSLKSLYTGEVFPDYDTTQLLTMLSFFSDIRFEAFVTALPKETVDSITASRPFHVITLEETSGKKHVVRTFHRKNPGDGLEVDGSLVPWDRDRMYALINDGKDFVLIQFFVFDNILKPVGAFLGKGGLTQ